MPSYAPQFGRAGELAGGAGLRHADGTFSRKLSPLDEQAVCVAYRNGDTVYQLAKTIGISAQTVCNILHRCGEQVRDVAERHRKYNLNETAFDGSAEHAAYWTGFLMADGCVEYTAKSRFPRISLHLQKGDIEHVGKFCDFLGTERNRIGERKRDATVSVQFYSDRIGRKLAKAGVVPRKSLTAKALRFESNRHFWRGVVDGDGGMGEYGSVHKGRMYKYPTLFLAGSQELLEQFRVFVVSKVPLCKNVVRGHGNCSNISLYGKRAISIIRILYSDAAVALDRKAALARGFLSR
jgi:hypothetical protein